MRVASEYPPVEQNDNTGCVTPSAILHFNAYGINPVADHVVTSPRGMYRATARFRKGERALQRSSGRAINGTNSSF
jgi:hypothetical protein